LVEDGAPSAERDVADPGFRSLESAEQRQRFLEPVPIRLTNVRIFLDIEVGSRRELKISVEATVHRPAAMPQTRSEKLYTTPVHTESNDVFVGYPASGGEVATSSGRSRNWLKAAN
jgi:hypothetical protein